MIKIYLCLIGLFALTWPVLGQKMTEPGWDPDTVRVFYFDDCCAKPFPPSARFPYHGATVRTLADAAGNYEDQMRDAESLLLLFTVLHQPVSGHAQMTMYYPNGKPRLQAQFLEDTTHATPVVYLVPSLRRPLSAYAKIDGELQTFYESGARRQQAEYRLGQRVRSQCYDFRGRPVECNANPPVMLPRLPDAAISGTTFLFAAVLDDDRPPPKTLATLNCEAAFLLGESGEPLALRLKLPRPRISAESAALAAQGGRYSIYFGLAANAQGSRGTGSHSDALNQELRFIGLEAGRLFYYHPTQPLRPALVDGEPVATYFTLPIEFGLLP